MIDPQIKEQIDLLRNYVDSINVLMDTLHQQNVEVRILYKDPSGQTAPRIELWRATEHINYLKENTQ